MNDPRGSVWRKWDLHVHTPASIVQQYGGDTEEAWEKFFLDIEDLPPEFKVIGINDYIFIDGYRKVLAARNKGRLGNIDLVLPVIELRLDKFGGAGEHLSRVNFHIIFSDEVPPDVIEQHFLNALPRSYRLMPQYDHLLGRGKGKWQAIATRESLSDLGRLIIESVPPEERKNYESDLVEGFRNLNFNLEQVLECLESSYFEGQYLTGVGKTEWANIGWNDHTIADKKNIINAASIVFVAAESIAAYHRARESLTNAQVNNRLLDCSDAHTFRVSQEKDRIGNCFTWIKADPTFQGLRHALREPAERIFIGDLPEKVQAVRDNSTRYIHSVRIYKKPGSTLAETWFGNELVFSPDLVAIIGNKGTGKSALTDILALLGNACCTEFSFLNDTKFCHPRDNKGCHFEATLRWESGETATRQLSDEVSEHEVELVKYIPQQFFETICNEIEIGEGSRFDAELKRAIFSHIDVSSRLGFASLDDLVAYRTEEIQYGIEFLKQELQEINAQIVGLEQQTSQKHRASLQELNKAKERELQAHDSGRPEEPPKPASDSTATQEIERLRAQASLLASQIDRANRQLLEQHKVLSAVRKLIARVDLFRRQYESFRMECRTEMSLPGIDVDTIVRVEIDKTALEAMEAQALRRIEVLESQIDPSGENSLVSKKKGIEEEAENLRRQLDETNRKYQNTVRAIERWAQKRTEIIGDEERQGSLAWLKKKLQDSLNVLPGLLAQERSRRVQKAAEIYREIRKIAGIYEELYAYVQGVIDQHVRMGDDQYRLNFEVAIEESQFCDKFFEYISHTARGSFHGQSEGRKRARTLLAQYDLNEESDVIAFLEDVMSHLEHDKREDSGETLHVEGQLRKGTSPQEFYDFVFSLGYLVPKYAIQLNGKDIRQLSPGERGVLLLIFYLLVDKADCPLIIDQPEENLDSQSVYELLVPYVKAAKQRRQIFLVTHNPNLAVVCDAEQIIHAFIDKSANYEVFYTSGAIENPVINQKVVDVLEGTWPAFENRESKYIHPVE